MLSANIEYTVFQICSTPPKEYGPSQTQNNREAFAPPAICPLLTVQSTNCFRLHLLGTENSFKTCQKGVVFVQETPLPLLLTPLAYSVSRRNSIMSAGWQSNNSQMRDRLSIEIYFFDRRDCKTPSDNNFSFLILFVLYPASFKAANTSIL